MNDFLVNWVVPAIVMVPIITLCYLVIVGLDAKPKTPQTPPRQRTVSDDDDDGPVYKSERQMQHEWYGDNNSDLNWRDRELGEALGIEDGDTYKSNWQ